MQQTGQKSQPALSIRASESTGSSNTIIAKKLLKLRFKSNLNKMHIWLGLTLESRGSAEYVVQICEIVFSTFLESQSCAQFLFSTDGAIHAFYKAFLPQCDPFVSCREQNNLRISHSFFI